MTPPLSLLMTGPCPVFGLVLCWSNGRTFVESGHEDGQFYIELIKSIYVWTYKEEFIAN